MNTYIVRTVELSCTFPCRKMRDKQQNDQNECQKCMKFVQRAIEGTRCQRLLKSMGLSDYDYSAIIKCNKTIDSNVKDKIADGCSISLTLPLTQPSSSIESPFLGTSSSDQKIGTKNETGTSAGSRNNVRSKSIQVICTPCGNVGPEAGARAYVKGPEPLSIVLCSNRLPNSTELESALVHELIHVYDVWIRKWDLRNCFTLAQSEVRAAKYAECATDENSLTAPFFQKYCIKNKAIVATTNMFPENGKFCVKSVLTKAMKDEAPFQNVNHKNSSNPSFGDNHFLDAKIKGIDKKSQQVNAKSTTATSCSER